MIGLGEALALTGAALAVFLGGSGSSIGLGYSARAASAILVEKPERYGLFFIMVVLPGTQGFYGFLAGFIVLLKMNVLGAGGMVPMTISQGCQVLAACLPVGVSALVSAIYQGKVCAGGIMMAAKRPEMAMKAGVIYAVMIEVYAVLGLLISLFVLLMGMKWPTVQ